MEAAASPGKGMWILVAELPMDLSAEQWVLYRFWDCEILYQAT
jgi:hypothetical protein